jgi:hypothetical protein
MSVVSHFVQFPAKAMAVKILHIILEYFYLDYNL